MSKHLVAAAQLGPASPTHAETVARIVTLINAAADAGAQLVVFPELALSPYFPVAIHDDVNGWFEREMPSTETQIIFAAAARRQIAVVLPFAELESTTYFNSAVLIDQNGREVGRFRKVHIPGLAEPPADGRTTLYEKRYFRPGNLGFPVYDSPVGKLGMLICADRRYPESYRCHALGGAELIVIGYNTGLGTDKAGNKTAERGQELSELAMRAGANANGVYIIASGKAGIEEGSPYIGGSCIIDPVGDVLAKAKTDGDELVLAEIDRAEGAKVRGRKDFEVNRHPEHYGIIGRTPVAV